MNIEYSKEVLNAINLNIPIIALESTIISHGMPYPKNLETAKNCEQLVRDNGCCPATIAIIKGKIKIGLEYEELEYLAKQGTKILKVSRRDIPLVIAKSQDGATTVAATMILANLANIKFFATGGIGGVHRGAENTFDISADLDEFSKTNVLVVSAGVKSILDLPKTMEYLETKGVLILGYKTDYLPEFYTNGKTIKLNYRVDDTNLIANIFKEKNNLNLSSGMLVCNPIPKEYEMDYHYINNNINNAIEKMNKENINGKEATPYLLKTICDLTEGKSLESNIKLVYNNVILATKIAKDYYNIK